MFWELNFRVSIELVSSAPNLRAPPFPRLGCLRDIQIVEGLGAVPLPE